MRLEILSNTSYGIRAQSAVMKSVVVTPRSAEGVVIGTEVAHDADGAGVGEYGEILVDATVKAGIGNFFTVDGVGIAQDVELFFGDVTHDANAQAWTWERLTPYEVIGQTELQAELTHFILKEHTKRFDEALKFYYCWETANVVVALDHCPHPRCHFR